MSHFAQIDENGIVQRIIVAEQDFIDSGAVGDPASWVQTSYHGNIRKNFAGVGYTYDAVRDAFISPQPYPSWILDEQTCQWSAPITMPSDGQLYAWDEPTKNWVNIQQEGMPSDTSDTPQQPVGEKL